MAQPVSGPHTVSKHQATYGSGSTYDEKVGYRQAKPFNLPLPYEHNYARIVHFIGRNITAEERGVTAMADNGGEGEWCSAGSASKAQYAIDWAVYLARAKFMDHLHEAAQHAVNTAERKEAAGMMMKRITQIANMLEFVRDLKRGNISPEVFSTGMKNILKTSTSSKLLKDKIQKAMRKWRSGLISASDLWLEFHFGWEPMVADIQSTLKIFDDPIPSGYFKTSSKRIDVSWTNGYRWSDSEYFESVFTGYSQSTVFGTITVSNLDLYRAQRLGLLNPLAFGVELIPFSFVAGWFSNLSDWCDQFTDTLGVSLTNAGYSTYVQLACNANRSISAWKGMTIQSEGRYSRRYTSLPGVVLNWKPEFKGFSIVRGATALALVCQLFEEIADEKKAKSGPTRRAPSRRKPPPYPTFSF